MGISLHFPLKHILGEADHLSHIPKCMEVCSWEGGGCSPPQEPPPPLYFIATLNLSRLNSLLLSSCLSFVQVDCFSRAVLCVRLDSPLSGPDGLCRFGNQGEMFSGGGQREGRKREVTEAATGNLIKFLNGSFNGHVCFLPLLQLSESAFLHDSIYLCSVALLKFNFWHANVFKMTLQEYI